MDNKEQEYSGTIQLDLSPTIKEDIRKRNNEMELMSELIGNSDQLREVLTNLSSDKIMEMKQNSHVFAENLLSENEDINNEENREFMKTFDIMLDLLYLKISEVDFINNDNDPLNIMIELSSKTLDLIDNDRFKIKMSHLMDTLVSEYQNTNEHGYKLIKSILFKEQI